MMQGFLDGYIAGDGYALKQPVGSHAIVSANRGFLDELAAVLGTTVGWHSGRVTGKVYVSARWFDARGGKRPRRAFEPHDVPLLPPDAEWVPIDDVRPITATGSKPFTVYSFDCAPQPTFLVSGILTHNCEHHLVPFAGKAHVAYIPGPDGRITGLSKIARLVDGFARRPQVQERLTTQVADALVEVLEPTGVLVMIEAEHLCMSMRGVKKPGALTITSAVRGLFKTNAATRAEAMSLITYPGNRL
jgi:GTP cyclohydrolase I